MSVVKISASFGKSVFIAGILTCRCRIATPRIGRRTITDTGVGKHFPSSMPRLRVNQAPSIPFTLGKGGITTMLGEKMIQDDPFNLRRFLSAQEEDYQIALEELRRGQKESHWIWYIFPQVMGLGSSSMAQDYAIRSREEALAYLTHPRLGERLKECCETLLMHEGDRIEEIMGFPDDMKLKSSMTLFLSVAYEPAIFDRVLEVFFDGVRDEKTINFLGLGR